MFSRYDLTEALVFHNIEVPHDPVNQLHHIDGSSDGHGMILPIPPYVDQVYDLQFEKEKYRRGDYSFRFVRHCAIGTELTAKHWVFHRVWDALRFHWGGPFGQYRLWGFPVDFGVELGGVFQKVPKDYVRKVIYGRWHAGDKPTMRQIVTELIQQRWSKRGLEEVIKEFFLVEADARGEGEIPLMQDHKFWHQQFYWPCPELIK